MSKLKTAVLTAAALIFAAPAFGHMSDDVIRIGVLNDMSSVYAASGGMGSVEAAKLAAEEFGNKIGDTPIEVIYADHQNKPDVGAGIAREWFDQNKVDAIVDLPNSGVALAVIEVARQRNRVAIVSGGGSSDITGKACSPTSAHWTYDTYATAAGSAKAMLDRGGNTWFFITADYAFGHALERDVSAQVTKLGGKVLGGVKAPLNTADYGSFLLQAQAAKPKVLALATGGNDTGNAIKQAYEFGLPQSGIQMIGLQSVITDVHAVGLPLTKGLLETTAFYWDRTPESRAWSKRYFARTKAMPTMMQAGVYSATRHYLQAIKDAGHDDGLTAMQKMKATPVRDMFADNGTLREDGRMVHDMYLLQVKAPDESKEPWDYYKVVATLPGDGVFRPLSDSECPLIKK
ncbi:MAG TPA: ABC transporter substrate-binding protein [Alphaproteobacteria bacterium]